jgi:hypothetical protein
MQKLLALANSATQPVLGLANDLTIGADGWALIPYGDSLHNGANAERANSLDEVKGKPGVIQRFTRERAVGMANVFHSFTGKIKRAVIGMDVYRGHPDCAAFAKLFPDKSPRGTIADLQARDDGLALKIVLNERGAADVESGFNQFSPYWMGAHVGEENGRQIYEPALLKSIGLVPKGNIPGLSLVNAAPDTFSENQTTTMKDQLIALLALLGITVPPETADDAFAPFIDQAKAALKPKIEAEAELPAANAKMVAAQTALTETVAAAKADKETALANAKTETEATVKTLRTAAAQAIVTSVIAAGKLPAAKRDEQVVALANAADFGAAALALANTKPVLPTSSRLSELSQTGKDQQSRSEQLLGLVNAHMATAKCTYDEAFAHVSASDAGKAITAAMKKPATV